MECTKLVDRFTMAQKISARGTLYGSVAVAVWALYAQAPWAAVSYLAFLGVFGYLSVRSLCSRCPYPRQYSSCLLIPDTWVVALVPEQHTPLLGWEKLCLFIYLSGMFFIPQYSLFQRPVLLVAFWVLAVPALWLIAHRLCHRCRHRLCPLNKVKDR